MTDKKRIRSAKTKQKEAGVTRTERLLALILMTSKEGTSQQDKIVLLRSAGFSNAEIAGLVGATPAVVGQSVYAAKRKKPKRHVRKRKQ
jgi:hypothetical protein